MAGLIVASAGASATVAGVLPGTAVAATPKLAVLVPKQTTDVRVDRPTLVVRVRATGQGFRARVDGRDVTRRFGRAVRGVRTATLVRGRDFRVGDRYLSVAVGRAGTRSLRATGFSFSAWRRDPRPLVMRRRAPERAGDDVASALSIAVRARGRVDGERMWVNGREVRGALTGPGDGLREAHGRCGCRIDLGAHHGLRFGSNRITVEVEHPGHRVQRTTRFFRIGRNAPLASAGLDRRGAPEQVTELDGSRSLAARRGTRLVYRWQIVAKPRGSRARLLRAGSARPRLVARRPGRYRVRLHVAEVSRAGVGRGRARSSAATDQSGDTPSTPLDRPDTPSTPLERPDTPSTPLERPDTPSTPLERPDTPSTPLERPDTPSTPLDRPDTPSTPLERPGTTPSVPLTTPLGNLQTVGPIRTDDVLVSVGATADPMGVPIQTIAADGKVKVGSWKGATAPGKWLHVVAVDEGTADVREDASFAPSELKQAQDFVDSHDGDLIVMAVPARQNLVGPTPWYPSRKANFDEKTFGKLIASVGGIADTPDGWASMSNSHWSLIGWKGLTPGRAHQNVDGWQAGVPGYLGGSPGAPGTLNGYLQMANNVAYSYVSPENYALDTAAEGSDGYTRNVIAVGDARFSSAQIANGDTAAQLVVLDGGNGLKPLVEATYTLIQAGGAAQDGAAANPAAGNWGSGVKGLASTLEYVNRTFGRQALIVMQTFGQGQSWGNTPNASPSWANDDVGAPDLGSWNGGQFVKSDGSDNPNNALYKTWNPVGPTVAGQVGSITSPLGHDVVSGFGAGQNNQGKPNGGLTVVANSHPYDGRQNRVQGQTGQIGSQARMLGTLTRTKQGQWTVRTAVSNPAFDPSELWGIAMAPSSPWPYAQGGGYPAAMRYIARQVFGIATAVTDVRDRYGDLSSDWGTRSSLVASLPYPDDSAGFTRDEFATLKRQVSLEMSYVDNLNDLFRSWEQISDEGQLAAAMHLDRVTTTVAENSKANAEKKAKRTAPLEWLEIGDYSLDVASGLIGFVPGLSEGAEPMSIAANLLGLAAASTPETEQDDGETRGASEAIYAKAGDLKDELVSRYGELRATILHIQTLLVTDWNKLRQAGPAAGDEWALDATGETLLFEALMISTSREFYEALLPLSYTQWVISPNATGALDDPHYGPSARSLPGRAYRCWSDGDDPTNPPKSYPFEHTPLGALHYSVVHGWSPPGSTTPPAASNQSFYMLRVLKSSDNPMEVVKDTWRGNNPTIWHRGSDIPTSVVDPLFQPPDREDASNVPPRLGIDKTEFFADWNNGWGWRKAICS